LFANARRGAGPETRCSSIHWRRRRSTPARGTGMSSSLAGLRRESTYRRHLPLADTLHGVIGVLYSRRWASTGLAGCFHPLRHEMCLVGDGPSRFNNVSSSEGAGHLQTVAVRKA
jgi:hypothetical protein